MQNSIERVCCRVHSYYPLYPPHPDVPVDVEYFDVHCRLPLAPHLMILPSDLRCFIKVCLRILHCHCIYCSGSICSSVLSHLETCMGFRWCLKGQHMLYRSVLILQLRMSKLSFMLVKLSHVKCIYWFLNIYFAFVAALLIIFLRVCCDYIVIRQFN